MAGLIRFLGKRSSPWLDGLAKIPGVSIILNVVRFHLNQRDTEKDFQMKSLCSPCLCGLYEKKRPMAHDNVACQYRFPFSLLSCIPLHFFIFRCDRSGHESCCSLIRWILSSSGFEVQGFKDGKKALCRISVLQVRVQPLSCFGG